MKMARFTRIDQALNLTIPKISSIISNKIDTPMTTSPRIISLKMGIAPYISPQKEKLL